MFLLDSPIYHLKCITLIFNFFFFSSFRRFLNPATSVLIQFGFAVVTLHVPLFCVSLLRECFLPLSWETLWHRECKLHVLLSAVWFSRCFHTFFSKDVVALSTLECLLTVTHLFFYITVPITKHTHLI